MRKTYSMDLKISVVKLYLDGAASLRQLCRQFEISDKKVIRNWLKKHKNGELAASGDAIKRWRNRTRFKSEQDRNRYILLENEYLKKKLLAQGQSPTFIADLWSSRNPEAMLQLKKDAGL